MSKESFSRNSYEQLLFWKNQKSRMPLIIRGARQVGKTFLIKQFGDQEFSRYHYLNFEEDKRLCTLFDQQLDPKVFFEQYSLLSGNVINPDNDLIVFDEIQSCSRAITSLKYFSEQYPKAWIIAAGSLLGLELSATSYPVGKVELLNLYPFTFSEFLRALGKENLAAFITQQDTDVPDPIHDLLWKHLLNYFVVGGLPASIKAFVSSENTLDGLHQAREVQKTLLILYISDFAKHSGKQNSMHLQRVFESIPDQLAQTIDSSVKKFQFKDILPGKGRYSTLAGPIDWLIKASLALKCHIIQKPQIPLSAYTKENRFKLYLFDTGILGSLANLPISAILNQNYGSYKGFYAENFVAQELTAYSSDPLICWQRRSSEIEFLLYDSSDIIPVEVKSGKITRSKSLAVYKEKYSPQKAFLLSGKNFCNQVKQRVTHLPLYMATRVVHKRNNP